MTSQYLLATLTKTLCFPITDICRHVTQTESQIVADDGVSEIDDKSLSRIPLMDRWLYDGSQTRPRFIIATGPPIEAANNDDRDCDDQLGTKNDSWSSSYIKEGNIEPLITTRSEPGKGYTPTSSETNISA